MFTFSFLAILVPCGFAYCFISFFLYIAFLCNFGPVAKILLRLLLYVFYLLSIILLGRWNFDFFSGAFVVLCDYLVVALRFLLYLIFIITHDWFYNFAFFGSFALCGPCRVPFDGCAGFPATCCFFL